MDSNSPQDLQQAQSHRDDRRESSYVSPYSTTVTGTPAASHSEVFIPFAGIGTIHTDSSQPTSARHETSTPELHHGYDLEAGIMSSQSLPSMPAPKVVIVDRHNGANISTASSSGPTPLPPAIILPSRRNTGLADNKLDRTQSHGSTIVPPMRESRSVSLAPAPTLDRSSSTMTTGTGTQFEFVEEKLPHNGKIVADRLDPTIKNAEIEMEKYARRARLTGYALNIAIGLQVVLGALTTALSVVVKGDQVGVMTAVLGGFATIVASFLAKSRGSNEPELSITRVKDLEQFLRECRAFTLDHGHVMGNKFDKDVARYRKRFEELLGNANGERKLSNP